MAKINTALTVNSKTTWWSADEQQVSVTEDMAKSWLPKCPDHDGTGREEGWQAERLRSLYLGEAYPLWMRWDYEMEDDIAVEWLFEILYLTAIGVMVMHVFQLPAVWCSYTPGYVGRGRRATGLPNILKRR